MNIYKDILIFGFFNFFLEMMFAALSLIWKAEKRKWFWGRLALCYVTGSLLYFLPPIHLGMEVNLGYILVMFLIMGELLLLFKINVFTALFYSVAAFALQNLAWSSMLLFFESVGTENFNQFTGILIYIVCFALIYFICWLIIPKEKPNRDAIRPNIGTFFVSAVTLSVVYVVSGMSSYKNVWNVFARIYSIVCCILALFCQFGIFQNNSLRNENEELQKDKEILNELLYQGEKQRKLAMNTTQIIEMKCHDLKHQIMVLRNSKPEEREEQLKEMEKAVMIYGEIAKTGNYALDIVLTEKCLLCENQHIKFTYMVDGDCLSFLSPMDTASLFGNILDNAMESVGKEEEEKRIIRLHVSNVKNCVRIHCENYCGHEVQFQKDLPVSENKDHTYHGFGVKSIRFIVEKYAGNLVIQQDGDLFHVDVILPIPEKEEK